MLLSEITTLLVPPIVTIFTQFATVFFPYLTEKTHDISSRLISSRRLSLYINSLIYNAGSIETQGGEKMETVAVLGGGEAGGGVVETEGSAAALVEEGGAPVGFTYEEAQALKQETVWRDLATVTVGEALELWLGTLGALTAKNYASGMRRLGALRLIEVNVTLQGFALTNHDHVLDRIKGLEGLSECSRQARAACYLSFTRFLSRRTQGMIPKASASREGVSKTFYRVREKVDTAAMSRPQWTAFLGELGRLNRRDCLVAKLILQGGKRICEVLGLMTEQIDYAKGEITFRQSKTRGSEKETVITYPTQVMEELRGYIGERMGLVFVSGFGRPLHSNQLRITFWKAGARAGMPFKVTPHVLRATTVTYLKGHGFSDSDIMKVTGHASAEMVYAYDKSERAENASKKVCLV